MTFYFNTRTLLPNEIFYGILKYKKKSNSHHNWDDRVSEPSPLAFLFSPTLFLQWLLRHLKKSQNHAENTGTCV